MNSLLKPRTLNQILTARKQKRARKCQKLKVNSNEPQVQHKYEALLRKATFNNEDKVVLLRYIQKKYRIRFGPLFGGSLVSWICQKEKAVIDKHYDSKKKSYFVLRGHVSVCERGGGLRDTCRSDDRYQQVLRIEEGGLGCVFNPEESFHRCVLLTEHSILLQIDHSEDELSSLEQNCLLTTEQKEITIKKFPLFKDLDNLNKFYTPYFQTRLYSKGEVIYSLGDAAQHLFLVVEGEVELESKVQTDNPELEGEESAIAELALRNTQPRYMTINTETITSLNFFGEQEMIALTKRSQSAKCSSLTCLLILVPLQKFNKLLFYNEFQDCLISTAKDRQNEREKTIASATALQFYRHQSKNLAKTERNERSHTDIQFTDLNKKIYFSRTDKIHPTSKISLKDTKTKLIHGNPIRLSSRCITKPQRFSMLEVNKSQYESSLKKFRWHSLQQDSNKTTKSTAKTEKKEESDACVRTLRQIWKVLKLQNVLQQDSERLPLQSEQGKVYYNSYMRRLKHLTSVKSYRPKTINSTCRAKTEYLQYLQKVI